MLQRRNGSLERRWLPPGGPGSWYALDLGVAKILFGFVLQACFFSWAACSCLCQEFNSVQPPQLASPAQQLMMEQVEELAKAGEFEEAVLNLERLFDEGLGRIVEIGDVQAAGTLRVQRYAPVRNWAQLRLSQLLLSQEEVKQKYQQRVAALAQAAYAEVSKSKDIAAARLAADRFYASQLGPRFGLLLSDLYLERGWSTAALQAAQLVSSDLRASLETSPWLPADAEVDESQSSSRKLGKGLDVELTDTLPWILMWRNLSESQQKTVAERLEVQLREKTLSGEDRKLLLTEALVRVVRAAALDRDVLDWEATLSWVEFIAAVLEPEQGMRLKSLVAESETWLAQGETEGEWSTLGGSNARTTLADDAKRKPVDWPTWNQLLDRYTASSDRTAASRPRVGESERGTLPYHPVIHQGRVLINAMNRILAFDLETGRPWPKVQPAMSIFDSQISTAAYLPLGYPLVGSPRGTLSVDQNDLFARMGSPITGWANREAAADGGSLSYLIGLDLSREGSLLPGFPLRLVPPEFRGAEFEGAPLIWSDLIVVAIVERDNVGLRRSVAAFDRLGGQLRWRSGAIAAGTVEGSDRANLISHQLLSLAGGRLYYNTNLGSIACLDPLTGQVEWLVRYSRASKLMQAYPKPDRFRYRDLTPCVVSGGLVYCAPQDCPEIFALDVTTGDLVWATDDHQVADAIHILGVSSNCVIVSGDHLVWLDRLSGRVLGRFPGSTTPGIVNALPSPRGLGRGVVLQDEVYWPTAGEIMVFPACFDRPIAPENQASAPAMLDRIRLDSRGNEGGNLIVAGKWLLYAGPSRIMAFERKTVASFKARGVSLQR